jgi:hypothetical protein
MQCVFPTRNTLPRPASLLLKMPRSSSPLIEAIQRRRPLHVIQRIVEADPDSVSRQVDDNDNDDNWYPLHEAIVAGAPVDVVRFLAIRYPQALRAKDKMGWLPLHFAVQNPKTPNSLDVIRRLGSEWPDALRELTNGGWDAEQISIQLGNWEAALILDELWFERGAERNVDDGAILDGPWFGRGPRRIQSIGNIRFRALVNESFEDWGRPRSSEARRRGDRRRVWAWWEPMSSEPATSIGRTSRRMNQQQHQMPPAPPPQLPPPPFRRRQGPRSAMPRAKSSNCSRRRSQPS